MNPDGSGERNLTRSAAHDADGAWSPDGTEIVFDSDRSGGGDLYLMNAAGGAPRSLTQGAARDHNPAWSPDGASIAYTSDGKIAIIAADGTSGRTLVPGDHAAWSPDGKLIAFDTGGYVEVMASDGTGVRKLAPGAEPAWSRDGRRLAYVAAAAGRRDTDLYVMNADGSGRHDVVADRSNVTDPSWH